MTKFHTVTRNANHIILLICILIGILCSHIFQVSGFKTTISTTLLTTVLGAMAIYIPVTKFIYGLSQHSTFLNHILWGQDYINGLWSYEYVDDDGHICRGICRIVQTLSEISMEGQGLSDDWSERSSFETIGNPIQKNNKYIFTSLRTDGKKEGAYSQTTITIDKLQGNKSIFKKPTRMRGRTVITGGDRNNEIHKEVIFSLHPEANSLNDVVNELKSRQME